MPILGVSDIIIIIIIIIFTLSLAVHFGDDSVAFQNRKAPPI